MARSQASSSPVPVRTNRRNSRSQYPHVQLVIDEWKLDMAFVQQQLRVVTDEQQRAAELTVRQYPEVSRQSSIKLHQIQNGRQSYTCAILIASRGEIQAEVL